MSILDRKFRYINAASTDVAARFRSLGWTPPSERRRLAAAEGAKQVVQLRKPPKESRR